MEMAQTERVICASAALIDGGPGVRFKMQFAGQESAAFVIRYDGKVYGYLNSCAHIPVELDWMEASSSIKLGYTWFCATHGATYEPATGHCIMGSVQGFPPHCGAGRRT